MSASPNLPYRLAAPSFQWKLMMKQAACDLRVACPGIIQSFDPVKQTVTVQLALREQINVSPPGKNNVQRQNVDLPLLINVPIVVLRGGPFLITVPVQPGDECLVIFGDMCIDQWWQSGDVSDQLEVRRHDLSDGFAILGVWSQPNVVDAYSPDTLQVRSEDGAVVVELTEDTVNVTAPNEVNVNADVVNINGATEVFIQDRPFLQHTHAGVQTGTGVTGPVV